MESFIFRIIIFCLIVWLLYSNIKNMNCTDKANNEVAKLKEKNDYLMLENSKYKLNNPSPKYRINDIVLLSNKNTVNYGVIAQTITLIKREDSLLGGYFYYTRFKYSIIKGQKEFSNDVKLEKEASEIDEEDILSVVKRGE